MRCVGLAICDIWCMKVLCLSRMLAVRIRSFGPASLHAVAYASHQFQSWRTGRRGYASIARHTRNASSLLATRLVLHVLTAWQCGTCVVLIQQRCLLLQADLLRGVAISGLSALPTSPSVLGGVPLGDSPLAQAFAVRHSMLLSVQLVLAHQHTTTHDFCIPGLIAPRLLLQILGPVRMLHSSCGFTE